MPKIILFVIVLLVTTVIYGCRSSNRVQGLPALYPCRLTLIQDGKPLADASVQLYAEEESIWPVTGLSDASGTAILVTYGQFPGVPLGKYQIVVKKTRSDRTGGDNEYSSGITKVYSLIEIEHIKKDTTKLEITIEKGQNSLTIDVGKSVEILVDTITPDT